MLSVQGLFLDEKLLSRWLHESIIFISVCCANKMCSHFIQVDLIIHQINEQLKQITVNCVTKNPVLLILTTNIK